MLLSIVVLSYNRPDQIRRIFEKLRFADNQNFNLIIKDDCSPKFSEIENITKEFARLVKFEVILHKNVTNCGYDANLIDSFHITDAEYVFLLSDDDYISGDAVEELVELLEIRDFKLYFTPYYTGHRINRASIRPYKFSNFHEIIYNAILFSGLIFHRKTVLDLPKDVEFLSDCIYSQVYLAIKIAYEEKKFGVGPMGLLFVGGDGENFFGKNEAAVNRQLLSDRKEITANLKYQRLLVKVVKRAACETDTKIFFAFERERNRRLVSYLLKARGETSEQYRLLSQYIGVFQGEFHLSVKFFVHAIHFLPPFLARALRVFFITLLRRSG
jgi:glycosyltransferase involved in cell wall biosynthesis